MSPSEKVRKTEVITKFSQMPGCKKQARQVAQGYLSRVAAGESVSLVEFRNEFWEAQNQAGEH